MRSSRLLALILAGSLTTPLLACTTDATDSVAEQEQQATAPAENFPTSVSHAFGTTTVESAPTRVATVGWANHEVPLALDVVPVGMSKTTWGDDDGDGVLPWTEEKLAELGAETPVLFDETDAIPFEQVADTRPDVILAAYSGLTREDYEQLSKIAPTIAYPEIPWGTSMSEMIELNATALGLAEEGRTLQAELDEQVSAALAQHPGLTDTKVMFTAFGQDDLSQVGFYTTADPRARFLADAGLGVPDTIAEISADSEVFWETVSAENPEAFADVELIITYGSDDAAANESTLQTLQTDPLWSRIPAVEQGNVAFLGEGPQAAATNPSPLSVPWGIGEYFTTLAEAQS